MASAHHTLEAMIFFPCVLLAKYIYLRNYLETKQQKPKQEKDRRREGERESKLDKMEGMERKGEEWRVEVGGGGNQTKPSNQW